MSSTDRLHVAGRRPRAGHGHGSESGRTLRVGAGCVHVSTRTRALLRLSRAPGLRADHRLRGGFPERAHARARRHADHSDLGHPESGDVPRTARSPVLHHADDRESRRPDCLAWVQPCSRDSVAVAAERPCRRRNDVVPRRALRSIPVRRSPSAERPRSIQSLSLGSIVALTPPGQSGPAPLIVTSPTGCTTATVFVYE